MTSGYRDLMPTLVRLRVMESPGHLVNSGDVW